MAYEEHVKAAGSLAARCAVLTLSDTRNPETDASGKAIREMLVGAGHAVADYAVMPDEPLPLDAALRTLLARADVDVVFTNGGTGISRRDTTVEVVTRLLDQPLAGFGELFRMLSFEQIGSGAILSRSTAGVAGGKLLFALPGSTKAVELAMTRLILPELRHLLHELRK